MGQNQPVDQVTAAALLKYGQKCTILVRFREIERIKHVCKMISQILSSINTFNINAKLLTQAFTWMSYTVCQIIDKCTRELSVCILTLNFTYFFILILYVVKIFSLSWFLYGINVYI